VEFAESNERNHSRHKCHALEESIETSKQALRRYAQVSNHLKFVQRRLTDSDYARRIRESHDNLLVVSSPIDQLRIDYYLKELNERGRNAIALVKRDSCGSCGRRLSKFTIERILSDSDFTHCPNCRKILCLDPIRGFAPKKRVPPRVSAKLDWEVLPEGWWEDRAFVEQLSIGSGRRLTRVELERLHKLASLGPLATYQGKHMGKRRYTVFEFGRVTLAECYLSGNALYYYLGADWKTVFALTKREALTAGARRLVHRGDWLARVREVIGR
jgi:hypothetical protein